MAQVLVRDLDAKVVGRLKARAERRGRSLQVELKTILEDAAQRDVDIKRAKRIAANLRRELAGRKFSDSAKLIAQDRRR